MSKNGSRDETVELDEALERARISASRRIVHIGSVLRYVDMKDGVQLSTCRAGGSDGLVGDRKGGMKTDESVDQGTSIPGYEATALVESPLGFSFSAVSLRGAVAEKRPYAELIAGVREDIEGALDAAWGFVMVDERGGSMKKRFGHVEAGRRS
jgi:hypothetical protein